MTSPDPETLDVLRLHLMAITESLTPMHEMIEGEVAHFVRRGFTEQQARAMTAAEFTSLFGLRIENAGDRPEQE